MIELVNYTITSLAFLVHKTISLCRALFLINPLDETMHSIIRFLFLLNLLDKTTHRNIGVLLSITCYFLSLTLYRTILDTSPTPDFVLYSMRRDISICLLLIFLILVIKMAICSGLWLTFTFY